MRTWLWTSILVSGCALPIALGQAPVAIIPAPAHAVATGGLWRSMGRPCWDRSWRYEILRSSLRSAQNSVLDHRFCRRRRESHAKL
jgi:hypothetical protein